MKHAREPECRANYNLICQMTGQHSVWTDIEKMTGHWEKCLLHVVRYLHNACCYSKLILIWLSVRVKTLSDIGLRWVWRAVGLGPSQLHGEIRVPTTQGIWWTVTFLFREAHIELLRHPLLCVVHRRQKTLNCGWHSTPRSWALDFQLSRCSSVNITSSVINQVACSGLSNSRSNLSWSFWVIVC